MPIASPHVCPILVEREADQAALDTLLGEAAEGHGRLAVLLGEAGVGKSRLAHDLAERAAARGFHLLIGGCTERDRDFPFAPVIDALRQLRQGASSETANLLFAGARRASLAELLPELRDGPERQGAAGLSPEQVKRRLFESIAEAFASLAAQQPLMVVFEDLHWADPTSLELLEMLPRRLAASRLLIVGTARPDEPNQDLQRWLGALRRSRAVVELAIAPLGEAGVARMCEALLEMPPAPALVAALRARTGGNPFFIEETLGASASRLRWLVGDAAVPETIQETVLRRAVGLDQVTQGLLELAAIVGSRFSFDLLQAASGLAREPLLDALRALVDRSLLIEEGDGQPGFAFRHALTREALHGRLLEPRRRELHRVVGEALEQARPEQDRAGDTRDLSYHFHAAGIWDKTLLYAESAGAAAERLHATVEALVHYGRALDAALALDDARAASLHLRRGLALARLGAFAEAQGHLEAALALARQQQLPEVEQAALYDLAGLFASRDYPRAQALAEQALALARVSADRRSEGRALNRLGNVLTNLLRFDDGRLLHEDALAIFEREGDRWGSADSLDLIGMTRYLAGEVAEAREAFGRAAASFADLGDAERIASALSSRGLYLAVLDGPCATHEPPSMYEQDAAEGLRICQEIAWRSGESYALTALASAAIGMGQYGTAARQAGRALAIAEEIGHPQWVTIASLTLGILDVELGDLTGASERFTHALDTAREAGAAQWAERLQAWIAWCLANYGEPGSAPPAGLSLEVDAARPVSIGQRRHLAACVAWALAEDRPEGALAWADRLLAGAAGSRPAAAILWRAEALAALGSTGEADAGYLEARRIAAAVGPRSVLWRTAAARSRLWRERDQELAAAEAVFAREEIEALAASIPDEGRCMAFLETPEVRPWAAPAGRRTTASPVSGGLTRREREVAVLVARGLTNKEIARELFIAEKTVEMHVSSALGKLAFVSRAQLAAWTVTEGLASPPQPQG